MEMLIEDWDGSTVKILNFFENNSHKDLSIDAQVSKEAKNALNENFAYDITVKSAGPKGIGRLLNFLNSEAYSFDYQSDVRIEIVIRRPVPASNIKRIVPFYRRNAEKYKITYKR